MHVPQICLYVVFPTFVRAGWCCGAEMPKLADFVLLASDIARDD